VHTTPEFQICSPAKHGEKHRKAVKNGKEKAPRTMRIKCNMSEGLSPEITG
jgi:hypothetical protein